MYSLAKYFAESDVNALIQFNALNEKGVQIYNFQLRGCLPRDSWLIER